MEAVVRFNDKIQQNLHYPKDDIVLLDPIDDDNIDPSETENYYKMIQIVEKLIVKK